MENGVAILLENETLVCKLDDNGRHSQRVSPHGTVMEMLKECCTHPYIAKEELYALCYLVLSDLKCVAIEGCSGSGKTTLLKNFIQLFQRKVGEDVVFLHLGDQIDSKVLLGTYSSTITPGEFVWLPGVLTRAVKSGTWIILENLDAAPMDVISLLIPLVKNGELIVPGFSEPLKASSKFKMFCTLRESANLGMMMHSNFLKVFLAHCPIIHLESCTGVELNKMLQDKYSNLGMLSDSLVGICGKFGIHVRHLWKFCERISSQICDGRIISVDDFMLEVIDCLCASLSAEGKLLRAKQLSFLCGGISDNKVQQLCQSHKPVVQTSFSAISVGRAYVPRHTQVSPRACFAYTQSSLCLLESVCRCVQMNEPVLLVGETGVGKTAVVNYLSQLSGNKLIVFNVCQQTDSSELLGGFKPLQTSKLVAPCREEFERLFHETFSVKDNAQYLSNIQTAYARQKWRKLFKLMIHSVQSALQRLADKNQKKLYQDWKSFHTTIKKFQSSLRGSASSFAFSFCEGALVEAVKNGSWMLLDEINLASAETLQCLSSLLEGPQESFLLPERAELEAVKRHENFRLFCCMNPATDIGKKSLPSPIRNRFTELYVDGLQHSEDLQLLIQRYLEGFTLDVSVVNGIIRLYRTVLDLAQNKLEDGTGRRPHYSLRNLCRALQFARDQGGNDVLRSLYEGFCISYLSELRGDYHPLMLSTIKTCLGVTEKTLSYCLPKPPGGKFVLVEGFWLKCGSEPLQDINGYVLTESVRKNLKNLARVVSARRYPVLLQGPTSAGKTSLIQYLAGQVGQKCVRINNHEHTDLQEYVGMYTADSNGQLVFQEGVLVTAMRNGHWIILDELNLAPTEVLEALNRVLDDNRELFIPEIQQLVKAHDKFLLFGTQNPPGSYGGRKVLSRAFRNRFVELHFDDIPSKELENILQQKCQLPPSYSKKMVAVMRDLQERRSASGIFYGKYGLVTLRDLFRWAERYREAAVQQGFYDWEQHLAEDGYMLLGGRLRDVNERQIISEVIKKYLKRDVSDDQLFGFDGSEGGVTTREILKLLQSHPLNEFSHLVWTKELLQMAVVVYRAIQFNEPVLLVGNTGCGKTTVCQFLACLLRKHLFSINCHMHTEAADFLGGLRPVRKPQENSKSSALFEWNDGVVVQAMKGGGCLLVDEISLAEDAVLERLNSLLESSRTLVVSENCRSKGDIYQVVAASGFTFLATMNPSGDYGKKELSPALRNRFVEIWCSSVSSRESCRKIIMYTLDSSMTGLSSPWADMILDFLEWHSSYVNTPISVRDILSWVKFINQTVSELGPECSFYHGACLVFLDGIGCGSGKMAVMSRSNAEQFVNSLLSKHGKTLRMPAMTKGSGFYGISPFFIERGSETSTELTSYSLEAPGPHLNAFRLLRAMQLGRPLLLEGAPGVGKTSLVTALARASGHVAVRINLSEHTDINDLFGADLPVEGQQGVHFAWRDGPFLRALKNGHWILLDEMNLASQSVLEGLNACLDHRGEIYIPEIGKYFKVKTGTKIFACQNPLHQGGGRKGLPHSFINRFTQVYIRILQPKDHLHIASSLYPDIAINTHQKMITFTAEVQKLVNEECGTGIWEYNLRDILRWCELCQSAGVTDPGNFTEVIFCSRLRDAVLRRKVIDVYSHIFEVGPDFRHPPKLGSYFNVSKSTVQIGHVTLTSSSHSNFCENLRHLVPLRCQLATLEALAICVKMNWMAIVVGENSCGKSSVVRTLAQLTGHKLMEFPINCDTDTTEIVGTFQQVNLNRHCCNVATMCNTLVTDLLDALRIRNQREYEDSLSKISLELSNKFSPAVLLDGDKEVLDASMKWLFETLETVKVIAHSCGVLPTGVSETLSMLEDVNSDFLSGEIPGRFEWIDSVLVTALRRGHWLLISHANFCSPSVLDRLNCLLEPGGYLSIDERGVVGDSVPIVYPHPEFRLFLTMDPLHGEVSRAMRNRGIEVYMIPDESTMNIELHKEDLLSVMVSTSKLDTEVAQSVLHFCQALPEMTPLKVLTLARCVAFSPDESDLLKVAKRLQFCKEDEVCTIRADSGADDYCVIPSVYDHMIHPTECIVQRDISPLLHCLNEIKKDSFNDNKHRVYLPQLDTALEVFVSTSTSEDKLLRQGLIHQLLRLLESDKYRTLEALVYLHALKEHQQWACSSGLCYEVSNLIPGTNPVILHTLQNLTGLLRLHSIVNLEYLNQQVKSRDQNLLLLVSKDAFEGRYPVDCLAHPSLMYLYSYVGTVLQIMLDISTNCDTLNDSISLETILGWLRMFVQACTLPSMSLQRIACSWTLIKPEALLRFLPVLQTASQWQYLKALAAKLYPLEEMTVRSQMYESIRQLMGCSARLSELEVHHMNQVIKKDTIIIQNAKKMPPFLMLCDGDYDKRKCLLLNWMNSNQLEEVNENCDLFGQSSVLSSSDALPSMSAIHPAVYLLKHLLFNPSSDVHVLASHLLKYTQRLSYVTVRELKPLMILASQKNTADSKYASLLNCMSSCYGLLVDPCLTDSVKTVCHSLSESISSIFCFCHLAPQVQAGDACMPRLESSPVSALGNYSVKTEELQNLAQYLWTNANSPVFSVQQNWYLDLKCLKDTLKRFVLAILEVSISREDRSDVDELTPEHIATACAAIHTIMPSDNDPHFWEAVQKELLATLEAIKNAEHNLVQCDDIADIDLSLLETTSKAKIHLGLAMALVLCPPMIDPLTIAATEHHFLCGIVEHYSVLTDAWNKYYVNMTGRELSDLFNTSNTSPEFLCMPSCLTVLLMVRDNFMKLQDNNKFAFSVYINDRKYSRFSTICADMMKTVCSHTKVQSMLADVESHSNLNTVMKKLVAMTKALALFVRRIQSEFQEYSDIAEPFLFALFQVFEGVNSLTTLKGQKWKELLDTAVAVGQYPVGTCSATSLFEWIMSLLKSAQSGLISSTENPLCVIHKKLLLVGVKASIQKCESDHLRLNQILGFSNLLKCCWSIWKKEDDDKREKAAKEDSLYVFKAKTHHIHLSESDEAQEQDEVFPVYNVIDEEDTTDQHQDEESSVLVEHLDSFSQEELYHTCKLHLTLFGATSRERALEGFDQPPLEAYHLASYLVHCLQTLPGYSTNYLLNGAHIRMCHHHIKGLHSSLPDHSRQFNIYKHPAPSEATAAVPVLTALKERTEELLQEWPDHPVLNQIVVAVDKVLALDVTEPLMKILSGMEYILRRAQDWEVYASSHVSLSQQLESLMHFVLQWRRLELSCWKNLFSICEHELEIKSSNLWFYLYGLCHTEATQEDTSFSLADMWDALVKFMETSSIGDFELRLKMIKSFHVEMTIVEKVQLSHVIGNIYHYYKQFTSIVLKSVQDSLIPLEKELKEFLEVSRWNDGSYWAIKESSETSHRKLLKFMNKYKSALKQPVKPLLIVSVSGDSVISSPTVVQSVCHCLNSLEFVSNQTQHKSIILSLPSDDTDLELATEDVHYRMQKLVRKFVSQDVCLTLSDLVDNLREHSSQVMHELQSEEFLDGIEREKRKAAIKLNKSLKQNALGGLFKTLKKSGISYRRGAEFSMENVHKLSIVNIPAELADVSQAQVVIDSCYYGCITEVATMMQAFVHPSKDLTVGRVSRCKGFASHLLSTVCEQRPLLSEALQQLCVLQQYISTWKMLQIGPQQIITKEEFCHWQSRLCLCVELCLESITSLSNLIRCMPAEIDLSFSPLPEEMLPPIVTCKDSSVGEKAEKLLKDHREKLRNLYTKLVGQEQCKWILYYTFAEVDDLRKGFESVKCFSESASESLTVMLGSCSSDGLFLFLKKLCSKLDNDCNQFLYWMTSMQQCECPVSDVGTHCSQHVSSLVGQVLVSVQRVMLRHINCGTAGAVEFECCKDLHRISTGNFSDMQTRETLDFMKQVLLEISANCSENLVSLLQAVYPLLDQYYLLCKKLLTDLLIAHIRLCQLLSILARTFSTLAIKGFSAVNEEDSVDETGETDFVDMEAGGFDDGQGNKNVSNQAEPDNLDVGGEDMTSKPEDSHENDGSDVEVTDDFEGDLEDVGEESQQDLSDEDEDGKEENEHIQMGSIGSDLPNHIDRNMWAGEDQDNVEEKDDLDNEDGGGTALNEQTEIVAKDDATGEPSDDPQVKNDNDQGTDEQLNDHDAVDMDPSTAPDEDDNSVTDFGDLSLDDMKDQVSGEESDDQSQPGDDDIKGEDIEEDAAEIQDQERVTNDEIQHAVEDKVWSVNQGGNEGAEPNNIDAMDDKTGSNSDDKVSQDHSSGDTAELNVGGPIGDVLTNVQEFQGSSQKSGLRRSIQQRDDRSVLNDDKYEAKRQRIMETNDETSINHKKQESSMYQHIRDDEQTEDYDVAWDSAMHEQHASSVPPPLEDSTLDTDATEAYSQYQVESMDETPPPKPNEGESLQQAIDTGEEMDTGVVADGDIGDSVTLRRLDTFFSSGDLHYHRQFKIDNDKLRDNLMTAVNNLQEKLGSGGQSQEACRLWMKYEALVFDLSQALYEELRLILLPTKASQLKGDYRTGKRLSMRRIIPYIASNFQNDRIWLRRTKPSQREYQVLVAVDDSSSMHENQCKEMAYESLAVISSALSRLNCGQLGVCRFGKSVEVLHSLEKPFSATSGGFILQHLMFDQERTNFVELLRTAYTIFGGSLHKRSGSSPEISQLLLILSDGRGVFADGVQSVEATIRRLNDIGVFTVFVILDSLSKDSVVDIKVPSFPPGKPPLIHNYLELFPFSFYIVLRDIKRMPIVLGQAIRQWFELITSRSEV